jgi:hypothetical protein
MKKKELREQLIIVNDVALKLQDSLSFVAYENRRMADFIIKIGYTQEVLSDVIINGGDTERDELEKPLTMVKLENQMLRKTLYSQEEEIRDLTTLLSDAKEKVSQLNKALYFKEVYDERS